MSTKTLTKRYYDDVIARSAAAGHGLVYGPQTVVLTKSRTGAILPKFKQVISDGKDATTAFSGYEQSVVVRPGSARITFTDSFAYTDTYMGISHARNGVTYALPTNVFPTATSNMATAIAINKVYDDIRERQMPFSAQVFAAELRETLHLLGHPLESLASLTRNLASFIENSKSLDSKLYSGKKTIKSFAEVWLSWRLGVIPLLSDIQGIIKLFDDLAANGNHEVFRKKGFHESTGASSVVDISATAGLTYKVEQLTVYKSECYIAGGYLAATQQRIEGLSAIVADLQNLAELPLTTWEAIPFSFLIDYFVNIGDIIKAGVTSTASLRYVSQSVVNTTTRTYTSNRAAAGPPVLKVSDFVPKQAIATLREVTRVSGKLAIPPITVQIPGSKIRLANIAALAASLKL